MTSKSEIPYKPFRRSQPARRNQRLFLVQARVRVRQSCRDPQLRLAAGAYVSALVFATDDESASASLRAYLPTQQIDLETITALKPTRPELAKGNAELELLISRATRYGIAVEIAPFAFDTDPDRRH